MQQEFFHILAEFFERVTGKSVTKFATPDTFVDAIKKNPRRLANRAESAFPWVIDTLASFYSRHKTAAFQEGRETGGMKLVLGGGSHFTASHLQAVRKMLLYADTILIPDPVLPWLEVERKAEKFRLVNLLKNIFVLLHLKPLVEANLTYPAIIVFPSYEKSLEEHDEETRTYIKNLVVNFLSYYMGQRFESLDDTMQYVRASEEEFLQQVERKELFVPPGAGRVAGLGISEAIKRYRQYIRTWRSEQFVKQYESLSNGELVWNGIFERLAPQWHLIENADELRAQPMLIFGAHWHYYTLCTEMYQGRLVEANYLQPSTVNTLRALSESRFAWLGNVPIEALVKLREQNENEEFRKRISTFTSELYEAAIEDIDPVAAEVGRGIASLLREHNNRVQEIKEKYARRYGKTLVAAWVTLAANFVPSLAPFVSIVPPVTLVGKYVCDKVDEISEKRKASRSLTGVLAAAKEHGT